MEEVKPKKMIYAYFPESYIKLNQEIPNHPYLVEQLQQVPANEFELRLSVIAAFCGIVLDGYYVPSEFEKLAVILCDKLSAVRTGIEIHHNELIDMIQEVQGEGEPKKNIH